MKILCIQLARLGDIYQSWPTLNALRRNYPSAEIHILVRERFKSACVGLSAVNKIIIFPTQDIFAPLFMEHPLLDTSMRNLGLFTESLAAESYDMVINLSFSPASSYFVDAISHSKTSIHGYTRHADGFLRIPDDASSYFYAQVGVDRNNRIHLTDIFALVSGVELIQEDFSYPEYDRPTLLQQPYIVIHVGSSQPEKTCSKRSWTEITDRILDFYEGQIVFVGSKSEEQFFPTELASPKTVNLIGQTELPELFGILSGARALIGGDSVAVHMASLTATPTLNISFSNVRFWETGPRAKGSRVLWFENDNQVSHSRVATELKLMLGGFSASEFSIEKIETDGVLYKLNTYSDNDFSWDLVRALYMNIAFPVTDSQTIRHGFMRLRELASLGLEQIAVIQDVKLQSIAISILDEIDSLVNQVGQFVPEISPVVRWFQTEKLRIGPYGMDEVTAITRNIFEKLRDICQIYELNQAFNDSMPRESLTWKP